MAGQWWPQGGVGFYRQVQLPVLLLSGTEDHLVTLEEEMETHFVCSSAFSCFIYAIKQTSSQMHYEKGTKIESSFIALLLFGYCYLLVKFLR